MSDSSERSTSVRFGNFEADLRARELRKDGARVRLQDQPFQLLALLLERAGDVVTREELRQRLWPSSVYVDFDHGLNNAIARLREALGDAADTPRFIETLPRVGYRFIFPLPSAAQVREPSGDVAQPLQRSMRWRLGAGVGVAALVLAVVLSAWLLLRTGDASRTRRVSEPSIAVLPFVSLSSDADNEYFADGLTDELTQKLAGIRGLTVAGRTSVYYFKKRQESTAAIAKALGVNHLLEGSVRRSGDRLRITAQLIGVPDGYHLWSQTFDRNLTNIFEIQEDIALAVANALQIELASAETLRLRRRGTQDAEAYRLYVIAMAYMRGISVKRDMDLARTLLERALARDSRFAAAHAGIAQYHFRRASLGRGPMERDVQLEREIPLGLTAAERALALDPESSEALDARANFQWWLYDRRGDFGAFVQAQEDFRRAVSLDPSNSLAFFDYGRALFWYDPDLSRSLHERLLEIDPFAVGAHLFAVSYLGIHGQLEAARAHCRTPQVRSLIDQEGCSMVLSTVEAYFGHLDRSIVLIQALRKRARPDPLLWSSYLSLGDRVAARGALEFGTSELAQVLESAAALTMDNRHAEAFRLLQRERQQFEFSGALDLSTARLALIAGEPAQALAILKKRLPDLVAGTEPVNARNVLPALDLAAAWSRTGERDAARRLLERIGGFLGGPSVPQLPMFEFVRARMHALAGEPDRAWQALERAYQAGFRTTWAVDLFPGPLLYLDPVEADPCLASLRPDPRFGQWLARIAADNASQLERLRTERTADAGS